MYTLIRNNVDNYPSVEIQARGKPTKEKLIAVISQYFDDKIAEKCAEELLTFGVSDVNDTSCTEYTLKVK